MPPAAIIWITMLAWTFSPLCNAAAPRAQEQAPVLSMTLAPDPPFTGPARGFTLNLAVVPGYHINSDQPASPELIATSLSLEAPPGISLRQAQYPPPRRLRVAGDEQPWLVWDGKFQIKALLSVDPGLTPGEYPLTFNLFYQACNEGICHMPETAQANFTLTAP